MATRSGTVDFAGLNQGITNLGPSTPGETEGITHLNPEQDKDQGTTHLAPGTEPGSTSVDIGQEEITDIRTYLSEYLTPHARKRAMIAQAQRSLYFLNWSLRNPNYPGRHALLYSYGEPKDSLVGSGHSDCVHF